MHQFLFTNTAQRELVSICIMYVENVQQPLTFLALLPCIFLSIMLVKQIEDSIYSNNFMRIV